MAYLGNTPEQQSFTPAVDYFSGNGSTVAFTLSRPVASVAQVQATIENVPQNPGTAFTVSGNTITFDGAPPSGTNNIYVYYTSPITQVIQPGQGTVGTAQLTATGNASSSTFLRGDNSWQVVAVTPTAVSDQNNTSTGYFDLPAGTTAQRPGSPTAGYTRYNTETGSIEFYNGTAWIATNLIPVVNSVSGTIYEGLASTLTLSLSNATDIITVRFTESGTVLADVTSVSVTAGSATVSVPSAVYGQTAGDTIAISIINQDNTPSSNSVNKTVQATPTGGTIYFSGGYRYHKFTTSGTLSVPSGFSATAQVLVVAGGGGGGYDVGGGGGAGGLVYGTTSISAGSYTATVGAGGAESNNIAGGASANQPGANSSFTGITTAVGGGLGGYYASNAGTGGSGGGGGGDSGSGASGTSGQGNAGGNGISTQYSAGGGGGAGAAGQTQSTSIGGAGGAGSSTYSTWASATSSGDSGYYAGGGGGGGTTGGAGGVGGGGAGQTRGTASPATSGTANTGGGGGGTGGWSASGPASGAGGSGIVIVRYAV